MVMQIGLKDIPKEDGLTIVCPCGRQLKSLNQPQGEICHYEFECSKGHRWLKRQVGWASWAWEFLPDNRDDPANCQLCGQPLNGEVASEPRVHQGCLNDMLYNEWMAEKAVQS